MGCTVADLDSGLARHPLFGDSELILARVLERYRFSLEILARALPSVAPMCREILALDAAPQRRLFSDPGLRLAIEEALRKLEAGSLVAHDPVEDWLPAIVETYRRTGKSYTEVALGTGLYVDAAEHLWIGEFASSDDPLFSTLRENFILSTSRQVTCLAPDPGMLSRLRLAYRLLTKLLPRAGASALRHLGAIAIIEADPQEGSLLSASGGDLVPSSMVISPRQVDNPWDAAGHLLHESLHLKLFDVVRSHSLLRAAHAEVIIPWRKFRFTMVRALFAFHVYVHMVFFKAAVERHGHTLHEEFGEPTAYRTRTQAMSVVANDAGIEYGRSIERASYLAENLLGPWSDHLTDDGRDLVGWLRDHLMVLAREAAA